MELKELIFYVFALSAVGSAVVVVTIRNIVHAAFSLMVTLFSIAGLYVFLQADFLAATQVIVYVGGILVLILFGVMMTSGRLEMTVHLERGQLFWGGVVSLLILLLLLAVVTTTPTWKGLEDDGTPLRFWRELFSIGLGFQDDLDDSTISEDLQQTFENNGISLSQNVTVSIEAEGSKWLITDEDNKQTYSIRRKESGLRIWRVAGTTHQIGEMILNGKFLLPFEVVSILLLVALIGAALISREEVKEEA